MPRLLGFPPKSGTDYNNDNTQTMFAVLSSCMMIDEVIARVQLVHPMNASQAKSSSLCSMTVALAYNEQIQ